MTTPFASLQQLNGRRETRHHRQRSSPSPQVSPTYAYNDFHDRPTPRSFNSFNSFNSYAIPASSGSSQSWQSQPPAPHQAPPEHAHLFQPLPMPVPPRYSVYQPPPPNPNVNPQLGQGHAAPVPYYTYYHPHTSQAWSDPTLVNFAAGLDQRAAPITRDRPSEYDLSRRRVWDTYEPFREQPRRERRDHENVFLDYGDFSPKSGTWKTPNSPEQPRTTRSHGHRRGRSHSHSHSSAGSYPYQFYAYPVAAMAPIPAYYPAPQYYPQPQPQPKEEKEKKPKSKRAEVTTFVIPPPAEKPFVPPSFSYSSTQSPSPSSASPRRRKCFLARLFSGSSEKKPGMAKLPEPERRDVFFDRSPSGSSSTSTTLATCGSQGGVGSPGRKEVRWGEINHW